MAPKSIAHRYSHPSSGHPDGGPGAWRRRLARWAVSLAFGLVIFFFFCDFQRHEAGESGLHVLKGIDLVSGTWGPGQPKGMLASGRLWALFSLVSAACGLGVFLRGSPREMTLGVVLAFAGLASLVLLGSVLRGITGASLLFGFWGAGGCYVPAAVISGCYWVRGGADAVPPRSPVSQIHVHITTIGESGGGPAGPVSRSPGSPRPH